MKNFWQIDFLRTDRKFKEYEMKIQKLKEIEKDFQSLNTEGFESEVKAIKSKLKDPKKVDEIERDITTLKKKIKEGTIVYSTHECENCHKEFDANLDVCPHCGWTKTRVYGTDEDVTKGVK